jgi:ATP phosphoribosyltransferase
MYEDKLIIGMPAGSLADPNRGGNLLGLLKAAGFPTRGYDVGGPTQFPLHDHFIAWDGRPQEFGAQLAFGEIDVALGGDDWIQERLLELRYAYQKEVYLEKVLPLGRGKVRIVTVYDPSSASRPYAEWLADLLTQKPCVTIVTEMPYLALDWLMNKAEALGVAERFREYAVQKYGTPPRVRNGVVIYEPWGKTESKIKHGSVDLGVEITQTGSALRNYGLAIGEQILESEASIWVNPKLRENPQKYELARMFLLNLHGALYAEDKVLIFFNARKDTVPQILTYLKDNALYADEPTMNEGIHFTEFSVQVDVANVRLPLAQVRYELAKLGATGIETVPLESCIPGIHALKF